MGDSTFIARHGFYKNMILLAKWTFTIALFKESGTLLNSGRFLTLYGPFKIGKKHMCQSNYFLIIH